MQLPAKQQCLTTVKNKQKKPSSTCIKNENAGRRPNFPPAFYFCRYPVKQTALGGGHATERNTAPK